MPEFAQRQKQTQNSYLVSPAIPGRATPQPVHAANPLPAQQQPLSNQAAQRFTQSCPLALPSPSVCPFGGVCHTCPAPVQTKLTINQPGDKYEQEADLVAEQVMRMPALHTHEEAAVSERSQGVHIQRTCAECEDELRRQPLDEEEEEEILQAKKASGRTPQVAPNLVGQISGLRGRGQPLPESVRTFFESRFGYGLGQIRIHTDTQATGMAYSVNARAFTTGHHIVFGAGQYAPGTSEGRQLLAHELTHVLQQQGGGRASARGLRVPGSNAIPWRQTRGSPRSTGHRVSVSSSSSIASTVIQRWPCDDDYTRMINAALVEARAWRVSALRWLRAHEDSLRVRRERQRRSMRSITDRGHLERAQLLNRHFGIGSGSSIDTVRTIGRRFHDVDLKELTFQCRAVCPQVRGGGAPADAQAGSHQFTVYTNCYPHDMHVSCNANLVLHEAFHASFSDFNHDTYECVDQDYPGSRSLTNADSYARFAHSINGGLCGACLRNI